MRALRLALPMALGLLFLFSGSARADAPRRATDFTLAMVGSAQRLEQQNYIVNDTGCPWDPDDDSYGLTNGILDAGATVTGTGCVIQDWIRHLLVLTVQSKWSTFSTEIDYRVGPHLYRIVNANPQPISHGYQLRQCLWVAYRDQIPPPPEEGAVGGGIGVRSVVTFSLTNTGRRSAWFSFSGEVSPALANVWPNSVALARDCDPGPTGSLNIDQYGGVMDWNQPYAFWQPR